MTPQAIIAVLDRKGKRIYVGDGLYAWHNVLGWHAKISRDNQALWVSYNIRPGVWIERTTKFARPCGAPK